MISDKVSGLEKMRHLQTSGDISNKSSERTTVGPFPSLLNV